MVQSYRLNGPNYLNNCTNVSRSRLRGLGNDESVKSVARKKREPTKTKIDDPETGWHCVLSG